MKDITQVSPMTERILHLYTSGVNKKDIAMELGLSQVEVTRTLSKPDMQKMVSDLIKTTGEAIVAKNLGLIEGIIEAKLTKLKDEGKDLSSATSKDIVDLMNIVNSMTVQRDRMEKEADGNTYIQILNGILKD